MNAPEPAERPFVGILCMATGVAALTVMDAFQKAVVSTLPLAMIIVLRSVFVLMLTAPFLAARQGWRALRPNDYRWHAARFCCWAVSSSCFLLALRHLPLATAIAIGLSSPLFMTAFSTVLLGERVGAHRWSAVCVGFLGVLIITRPGGAGFEVGALYALVSAIGFALVMVLARRMSRSETDASMLVSQNLGVAIIGAPLALLTWQAPNALDLTMIAGAALCLSIGLYLTIRAFRLAPVGVVSPFHYTELVFGAALGWLIWNESVTLNVWLGSACIVGAGLYVIWREQMRARAT
jgi:drug/metabolite transporter (DMT)-like permease